MTPLSTFDGQLIDGLQFCAKAYLVFEEMRGQANGASRLRMRASTAEKKLLEEILPICKYIQTKYRTGRYISALWRNGSQQFDAEVFERGSYVDQGYYPAKSFLEATCVMHPNEYLSRELINTKGSTFGPEGIRRLKSREIESEPVVNTNAEFISSFSNLVVEQIKKKTKIDYPPDTSLIVQCSLNTLYTPDDWFTLEADIRKVQLKHKFREIFVYDAISEHTFSLWGKR